MSRSDQTIFSFVVDAGQRFTYDGWHLARSLIEHCGRDPSSIHIQCTPEVDKRTRQLFGTLGCTIHQIARFGDGRHCNKLNQIGNLGAVPFDRVVLLDADMIAIGDLRPFLRSDAILGTMVNLDRPPLDVLEELAARAGMQRRPPVCETDAGGATTYFGNCNGGFYSIPKVLCEQFSREWRRWARWLLDNNLEPLRRIHQQHHVDQISFWLAINQADLPFAAAPSNINYFTHIKGEHIYLDEAREIVLLHHHGFLDVVGLLQNPMDRNPREIAAVARANRQIEAGFDNRVFWNMRYERFPERGSGIGSRGNNLVSKRQLLVDQGIEDAGSVLDFGCGDIEVVKELRVSRYVGVDQSPEAIAIAGRARPDWEFLLTPEANIPAADMVLCFEVLIHQETAAAYRAIIELLAEKTLRSLLVSGFAADSEGIRQNPTLFFCEPLETSLRRTGRFTRIRQIGTHTNVTIYRCDV